MKQLFFILAIVICYLSCFAQNVPSSHTDCFNYTKGISKKDSVRPTMSFSWEYGFGKTDSGKYKDYGSYCPDVKKWKIKDTMGLINWLYSELEDANKRADQNASLHYALRDCLLHYPNPLNPIQVKAFDKYLHKYRQLLKQK